MVSTCPDPSPGEKVPSWKVWRSPPGQPAWARPALLGIAAVAALLYALNIVHAGYAPLYSSAVKTMSQSWKAFLFGGLNSQATLDKLPGSFMVQALSARIFGYHAWSLALPQVIEGVISTLVMYRIVRRWAGAAPGLLAAGLFATTPIVASMFGHSMEDGALVMCLVLAADSAQRAMIEARLRSLLWAGFWIGIGFQAKMLEAWMLLPALALAYLLTAPGSLRRRLWHLAAAGLVMLAVSFSLIAVYTLTPASDRPYISGSTDNSALAMVFGYNGLGRFGINVPGAENINAGLAPGAVTTGNKPPAGSVEPRPGSGSHAESSSARAGHSPVPSSAVQANMVGGTNSGWDKLFGGRFGPEAGWLYPIALLTLAAGLWWRRRRERTDTMRGGLVMWGTWLLTFGIIYSAMNAVPHTAYVAELAPPVAALSGMGIVALWRLRASGRLPGVVLSLAVAAELAWAGWLWSGYPGFLPWVLWTAVGAGMAAAMVLAPPRLAGTRHPRLQAAALAIALVAMLAPPVTWGASVLDLKYAGNSFDASAGPVPPKSGHVEGPANVRPAEGARSRPPASRPAPPRARP
ncbi:MAG: glycosyltransferase family 39 protein [Nocardiopsaceae bacterium]|nr:glycosyltransferase family 39 protein [Nocardiopsaceae bacterium]